MVQPFLALITPVGSTGPVDPGWSGGVAPPGGQPPLGIWGPPQMPPGIWPSPGHPRPPGPVDPGYGIPETGVPHPDHTLPQGPLGTWGGGNVPFPTPPIYLGPEVPPPEPTPPITWRAAWTPQTGWVTVGIPTGETPTPSE